ncbi:MAG: NAD(P)-dependent oxidoreductase [Pseudomonadota bacterium]
MRILFDPKPRDVDEIFSPQARARFEADYDVHMVDPTARASAYEAHLPDADVVISQQPMGCDRLDAAPNLRAIFNVETNFLPNIDYDRCFARGIHVLTPSSVFALPVAEIGLGMALSLARDIHGAHGDFVAGREAYGLAGNAQAELLTGTSVGFVGFGDLGRALHRLLVPFRPRIRVFDPWLPAAHLERMGVEPAGLEAVLAESRVVFAVAAITTENAALLGREALARMQDGAMLILLSRAALADFDALRAEAGRLRIATDVFPEEPVPPGDPIRSAEGMLFSAHRAGALTQALHEIGARVLEDLGQIARGLPPIACRRAERETIARLRSKPVEMS